MEWFAYLLSRRSVAIDCTKCFGIYEAHLIRGNTNDGTILVVQLEDIPMPRAAEVPHVFPNAAELGEEWTRYFVERVERQVVDDLSKIEQN